MVGGIQRICAGVHSEVEKGQGIFGPGSFGEA